MKKLENCLKGDSIKIKWNKLTKQWVINGTTLCKYGIKKFLRMFIFELLPKNYSEGTLN